MIVEQIENGTLTENQGVFLAVYNSEKKVTLMQMRSDGKLGFPGGTVDPGEDLITALWRELLEETGFDLDTLPGYSTNLFCSHRFKRSNGDYFHTHLFVMETDIDTMKNIMLSTITKAEHFIEENNGNFIVSLKEKNDINIFMNNYMANTVKEELEVLKDFINGQEK